MLNRVTVTLLLGIPAVAAELPERYFRMLDGGLEQLEKALAAQPDAGLADFEGARGRHFTHNLMVAAVVYAKKHAANPRYRDPKILAMAQRIGDMVAADNEKGLFTKRLDHHRDLYMWLESYRLLQSSIDEPRRARWRRELEKNLTALTEEVSARKDFPAYISPFIGTSPNHYSLWSSTVHLAGKVFARPDWEELGAGILHRFAAREQSPDGFWGEHDITGPTTGYNYLTLAAIAVYYEHSRDPAALTALRRVTDFHKFYTYPNGVPVEVINDRNRTWEVSPWGHFGFSNFPDGRRYADFLTKHLRQGRTSPEMLGRIAQNTLYFHEGPTAPIPQDQTNYVHRMKLQAGIRKTGPWVVALSGLIATQSASQFYLDRQGSMSVYHDKAGLIITGANSKRQPELATFWEKLEGQFFHIPQATRLEQTDGYDRLSAGFNSFFSEMDVLPPRDGTLSFRVVISPKSRVLDARMNLQLMLRAGETLETAAGKRITLGTGKLDLGPAELGGWIRHRGWTMHVDPTARVSWPVLPFNPYGNANITSLNGAVGVVSVPLTASKPAGAPLRRGGQDITFSLEVN